MIAYTDSVTKACVTTGVGAAGASYTQLGLPVADLVGFATIAYMVVQIVLSVRGAIADVRRNAGDRTSVEAFDVHHSLKGLDKSPSVACIGITGNLQGKRTDLLIADDIESQKNSLTEHQRQALLNLTRDFPSICATGRIVYLGTPQSVNSIYNTLPGRGYAVRIWTGRYPTPAQLENYGGLLAPMVLRKLAAEPELGEARHGPLGDQGAPLDTELPAGTEDFLCKKETRDGTRCLDIQRRHRPQGSCVDCGLPAGEAQHVPLKTRWRLPARALPLTLPAPRRQQSDGTRIRRR